MKIEININGRETDITIDGKKSIVKTPFLKKMYLGDIIEYYTKDYKHGNKIL